MLVTMKAEDSDGPFTIVVEGLERERERERGRERDLHLVLRLYLILIRCAAAQLKKDTWKSFV